MYFCLSCVRTKEEETRNRISKLLSNMVTEEFLVWYPKKETKERRLGKYEIVERPMFFNYLFVYWDGEVERTFPFWDVLRIPTVVRILKYDDGSHSLKGKDLAFARWIHMNDGHIKQSKVIYREGQRLHICEGPLKGFDGSVVKVDKHHKNITLRFELLGSVTDIKFSVDFLSVGSKSDALDRNSI